MSGSIRLDGTTVNAADAHPLGLSTWTGGGRSTATSVKAPNQARTLIGN
jgi:hypothetical protein